jgi:hypothetical protein
VNLLKDIASGAWQVLKTVAPTIADTAAGPFAPLVDPIMRKIFGTNDSKQIETALLGATPEQLLALKQADNEHAEKLAQLGIDRDKLAFDDTASARAMQVQTRDPIVHQLAWLNVAGFLAIAAFLIVAAVVWPEQVTKVPATAWATLGTVFGYLAKSASQTEAFFFGSSAGSQAKDATIADIAKQP